MAFSKSALKAKFVTGAIPTQTDFANLIDGMLSMPLGGGTGDTTINFGKGDSSDRIVVKSLRYIASNGVSYFLIGSHDYDTNTNFICVIIKFQNSPSFGSWAITYHVLDDGDRQYLYDTVGDINEADELSILDWLDSANLSYFNIENKFNNNPPAPRVVTYSSGSEYITWYVYPAIFNNKWVIGYALECTIEGGAGSTYQHLMVQGNNIVDFNYPDDVIVDRLRNGVWNKKML